MKVIIKAAVVADPDSLRWDFVKPFAVNCYSDEKDSNFVRWVDIETEVDDKFDMRAAALRNLDAEERQIMAESQAKITDIQRRKNELLAITMEPQS